MTSFRLRVLTFMTLVFAAVPALAQEETTASAAVNPMASLACLLSGLVAVAAVGLLARGREAQEDADAAAAASTPAAK